MTALKYRFKIGDIIQDISGLIGTIVFYYKRLPDYYGYTIKLHTNDNVGHDGYPYAYTISGKQVAEAQYDNLLWVKEYDATLIKSRKDFIFKVFI